MKIAMLGHKRIPSREGGVEIVVEELAARMALSVHDVTVYNRKGSHVAGIGNEQKEYGKKYNYKGVHVKTVWTLQSKSLNAIVYSFLATLRAMCSKAEVIHFHAEGPCSMIPLAKLSGKRCVATIHGLDWQRAKWGGFATRFLLFGEKMAAKHADEVIVLSKGVQQYFDDTYGRRTILIPNGINCPEYREVQLIKEKYNLQKDGYLLFLARLVPEKAVHTLIEAYEKSTVELPLVIAGGCSHSSEYEEKVRDMANSLNEKTTNKKNKNKQVILTGFVQGRELEELYGNCALYILPSEIEGMPLSLLEAMSYGCLCLTSDICENTDVMGECGLHFKTGDVDSLTQALNELVPNLARTRGEEIYSPDYIRNYVLKKYNWDDVVRRTLECYENING